MFKKSTQSQCGVLDKLLINMKRI